MEGRALTLYHTKLSLQHLKPISFLNCVMLTHLIQKYPVAASTSKFKDHPKLVSSKGQFITEPGKLGGVALQSHLGCWQSWTFHHTCGRAGPYRAAAAGLSSRPRSLHRDESAGSWACCIFQQLRFGAAHSLNVSAPVN